MILPEPEFLEAPERRLVALAREFNPETRKEMPDLWDDFWSREWNLPGEEEQACYGASYCAQPDGRVTYAVGLNIQPIPEVRPEGACIVTLSAGRYAVFRKRGSLREIPALFDAIFNEWLPNSGETQRAGAVFERYPYEKGNSLNSVAYEVWVPIEG